MWLLWPTLAVAADVICPEHGATALVDEAQRLEAAFYEVDTVAFDLARQRLPALVPCVQERMSVLDAVTVHRAFGVLAYVGGDLDAARRAFGAVHVLQPDWRPLPEQLAPEHPLWALFAAAAEQAADERELGITMLPVFGWSVDGTEYPDDTPQRGAEEPTYGLPADRAFVLQIFTESGSVAYTGYHFSTVDVPVNEMMIRPDPERLRKRRRLIARSIGTTLGGGLLVGAAVTVGIGMDAASPLIQANRQGTTNMLGSALDVQDEANRYGRIAAGLGGAGAALVSVAWVVPW
ncbi:MAG TPA: hypothetical protein PKA64_02535 [Myxococcota bacterium]|nr:hypothetical protein [Myxococcota bacterium]